MYAYHTKIQLCLRQHTVAIFIGLPRPLPLTLSTTMLLHADTQSSGSLRSTISTPSQSTIRLKTAETLLMPSQLNSSAFSFLIHSFKSRLKTHLFRKAFRHWPPWPVRNCDFINIALRSVIDICCVTNCLIIIIIIITINNNEGITIRRAYCMIRRLPDTVVLTNSKPLDYAIINNLKTHPPSW